MTLAYEQSRTVPLPSVSFAQLTKALDVVPGSLHYHIGSKDDLTSAIFNRFYRNLLERLKQEPPTDSWRDRLSSMARILLGCWREHRGAAEHIHARARYRVFRKVRDGERDHGAHFFDHVFALFRDALFTARQTALFYHTPACTASPRRTARAGNWSPWRTRPS